MSIYNYTVLKAAPIKVEINGEVKNVYRIRWHGKDYSLDYFMNGTRQRQPGQSRWDHWASDILSRRAIGSWGDDRPEYIIDTGANYNGKLDWNDPNHSEGFDVFKCSLVFFQEGEGYQNHVGKVVRVGRGKYKFIPIAQEPRREEAKEALNKTEDELFEEIGKCFLPSCFFED